MMLQEVKKVDKEKVLTITIGGYKRGVSESRLQEVYDNAAKLIAQYAAMGIPREQLEEMFRIEIVKEDD